MQWFEILIIIAAVSFVVLVTFFHFYNKKKKKGSSCCGDCSGCSGTCHIDCKKVIQEYHQSKCAK